MQKAFLVSGLLIVASLNCLAQQSKLANWTKLVDAHKCAEAKKLCSGFAETGKLSEKVEAQKCLAGASLCGHEVMQLQTSDNGGGRTGKGFSTDAVNKALAHLGQGIKLAPQDLSIHKGRLHIMETAGRFSEMIRALDESCSLYKGSDAPQTWLDFAPELMSMRQYKVGLDFMRVLDKHYPNSPEVVGNIGAFLTLLQRDNEAIAYLKKAAELAPKDPINAWDLGRAYDNAGQIELANTWYQKGIALQSDDKQRSQNACIYAQFAEQKLHDRLRACTLQKKDCAEKDQTACAAFQHRRSRIINEQEPLPRRGLSRSASV